MPDSIVDEELQLLARVTETLEKAEPDDAPSEAPIVRELERLRSLLVSGSESKDHMALNAEWHRQSSLLKQLRNSRQAPKVDPRSPYFAHLRLEEESGERDLCLGRATRIERGVRIVDWRNAPVTRIFYRYQQGDDYEEEFAGRLREGRVLARRMVLIRNAALERVEAPEGTFTRDPNAQQASESWTRVARTQPRLAGGEAAAVRAYDLGDSGDGAERRLGTDGSGATQRADKRLPEITGLIDPAQFELITHEASGFLVIRGSAGSGKTTVALHRIAYLAYDDPTVDSSRTLFITFSRALRNYVGLVLPSLGVSGPRIATFAEWAAEQRKRHFPVLPNEHREDTPAIVQRLKLHPALGHALEEQVRSIEGPRRVGQAIDDWSSVLTNAGLLRKVFDRDASGEVSDAELQRFIDHNRRRNEEIGAWLAGDREPGTQLDAEDDALLLRAWQLRVGPLLAGGDRALRYRHVAIDEVQDFSPTEVRVLLDTLDERRSITLAGDTQQHLVQTSGFTSWPDFFSHLGVPGTEVETLRVSYRSSGEIASFALSVLGDLREDDEPPITTRKGPPVELFRFGDRGACVAFLADALRELAQNEPLASVALLTPSPQMSAHYFEALDRCELQRLSHVTDQDFSFEPGIEITEIEQVKGLEFDYVVLMDVSADHFPDSPAARRLLHVGATRAIHQLWVTCLGTPSPLVAQALRG